MSKIAFGLLEGTAFTRTLNRWARAAKNAGTVPISTLRRERNQAQALKTHLDLLIHRADERLALPLIGATTFHKPHNADWAWRPSLWRAPLATPGIATQRNKTEVSDEVSVFHDCTLSAITLRQRRNLREEDLAAFALRMEVYQFEGSFLSLVIDLPEAAVSALKRSHIIRMDALVELEKPIEMFARLNIKNGPNTEQLVREMPVQSDRHQVEFDLAYSKLNEKRVERAWIDVIFERPQMNELILRDLTLSRRPRAHL
ncbi:MAG: DUF6478 family protein [Pseudomonadota bacterium]